ncbi:MAG TPA: hypothetical protein VJS65_16980, partial [Verrucomicrobiae bacterium]|nr:hypothetical protein [Verrucomicrobiae bacterium]
MTAHGGLADAAVRSYLDLLVEPTSPLPCGARSVGRIGWSGGCGRYQLQSTTNVATNPVSSAIFYRVQD